MTRARHTPHTPHTPHTQHAARHTPHRTHPFSVCVCACGRGAGDVKLWDSLSGNSIQTLKHPSAVNCLQVRDYNVVSAAKDVIYIWDMRMGRWHKLKSHTRPVLCMHYYEDNRLVLCSCPCAVSRVSRVQCVSRVSRVSRVRCVS